MVVRRLASLVPGSFRFDGRSIPYEEGDTIASALHRAGIRVVSRSMKYHRPRGLFCMTGSCASCLVDVDGVPNTPACTTNATEATVKSQNRMGSARHDVLGVVDHVYRDGFDPHGAFTRPRLLNEAFLKAVRLMSGVGKVPKTGTRAPVAERQVVEVDELIVGGGKHGLARLARAEGDVVLVDENTHLGGSSRFEPQGKEVLALAAERGGSAWTESVCFGLYEEDGLVAGVARRRGGRTDLVEVRPRRVTIAPGRLDAWPMFENNDLPGILSERGALRLAVEHGLPPGKKVVVHGTLAPTSLAAFTAAGATVVGQGTVEAALGGRTVTGAIVGGRRMRCDAIVTTGLSLARVELFQQAGCRLTMKGGLLWPDLAPDGATSRPDVYGLLSEAT